MDVESFLSPDSPDDVGNGESPEDRARRERNRKVERTSERHEIDEDVFPAVSKDEDDKPGEEPDEDLSAVRPFVGTIDPTPASAKTVTRIEIPIRTIVTVAVALFLIWVLIQIWGILLQVVLAFLLATALLPVVKRLESRGMPHGAASLTVFTMLISLIVGFFWLILPPLLTQAQSLVDNAPDYLRRFEDYIRQYPSLADVYDELRGPEAGQGEAGQGLDDVPVEQAIEVSADIVTRVANTFFVLVLTFYLMIEGSRAWSFLSRYFTPRLRFRMRRSYPEISRVVSGYVLGQGINSLSFGLFAFITTLVLGVPEALLLGVLAAVFDAVPIVGVPVATIPAVLLALTVSWQTAVILLVLYIVYQQFENYVMVPRVFGNTLQVSALSILVGVLIGGQLLGVIGIILALPLTATIPVLERVWNEPLPDDIIAAEEAEAASAAEHAEHPNGA